MGDISVVTPTPPMVSAQVMEMVLGSGDLKELTPAQRVDYLGAVCRSLGLNPLTQPLAFMSLGGKTVLYARRDCTDQLRKINSVKIEIISREKVDDLLVVTARATDATGRSDEAIGAVSTAGLKGEALANAMMKAETKSKRRVTLSLCGLGFIDETEADTVQMTEALAKPSTSGVCQIEDNIDPNIRKALAAFAEIKEQIGAEAYYRILGAEGYEHSNEIKRVEDRRRVYGIMQLEAKAHD